jgi:hypothetical protein
MQGRGYLDLAYEIIVGGSEVHRRGAVGRAYYALMLEAREALFRWGFKLPPRDNVHTWVRLRYTYATDPDMKAIGMALDNLVRLRNAADYDLSALPAFAADPIPTASLHEVTAAIALLDGIEANSARRAAAVAAIKKAFP